MSTASPEARAQCAGRLRILCRPGPSPQRQRNPDAEDRCRAAQRADVPRPTESERSEIATAIMFAYEAASARAQDAYPVEQDQAVRRVDPAGTYWINDDWLHRLHGKSKHLARRSAQ